MRFSQSSAHAVRLLRIQNQVRVGGIKKLKPTK
jgi:hypothetical protein